MNSFIKDSLKNPLFIIWIFYFAISPIYWFPFINISLIQSSKQYLFFFAVFLSLLIILKNKILYIPSNNRGAVFIIIFIICLLPALSNTDPFNFHIFHDQNLNPNEMINKFQSLMQFLPAFVVLMIFYNLNNKYNNLIYICLISSLFFSIFIFLHGLSFVFSEFNFLNPFEHTEEIFLKETGFGSYKSNWSNAIAVMFPLIILSYYKIFNKKIIFWTIVTVIFFIQILSAGRAGILSSTFIIIFFLFFLTSKRDLLLLLLLVIILTYFFKDYLYTVMKIRDIESQNYGNFQGFRYEQFLITLKIIYNNQIAGFGFEKNFDQMYNYFKNIYSFNIKIPDYELSTIKKVHNEFLRLYLEAGLFVTICFIVFLFNLFYKSLKLILYSNSRKDENFTIMLVGFSIVITSLFGYYTFFGSFNNEPIFWATAGILLSNFDKLNVKMKEKYE